jgi:anti-sigma factor (TIGR02949 family)
MSCGNPHETDCSEVLKHLYEYLDHEMSEGDCHKFEEHFGECNPCLEKYGLEQAVKKLVKRCCGHDDVPGDLRSKVMERIELIRCGELEPNTEPVVEAPTTAEGGTHSPPESSRATADAESSAG